MKAIGIGSERGSHSRVQKPTDVILTDAFIAKRIEHPEPVIEFGLEATGDFSRNMIYRIGGYTPRLFRRPRLARFAPPARRVSAVRSYWRWLK